MRGGWRLYFLFSHAVDLPTCGGLDVNGLVLGLVWSLLRDDDTSMPVSTATFGDRNLIAVSTSSIFAFFAPWKYAVKSCSSRLWPSNVFSLRRDEFTLFTPVCSQRFGIAPY